MDTWTDETILAGNDTASTTTLLTLAPEPDGRLRTDPVPLPRASRDAFGFGYSGGGPSFTYVALLRAAFDADSKTTTGPLRLPWPQVKLWARADRQAAKAVR